MATLNSGATTAHFPIPLSGLARALVQAERLTEAEAEAFTVQATATHTSFIEQIVTAKRASALEIARFAADTFGYPLLDLAAYDDSHIPSGAIDRKLIATHRVIPLNHRGNRIAVAIADPTNLRALDEICFQTGLAVDPIIVEEKQTGSIGSQIGCCTGRCPEKPGGDDLNLDFADEEAEANQEEAPANDVDDAPVVKFIQKILLDAINDGA